MEEATTYTAVDGVEIAAADVEGRFASPRSRSSRTPRGITKKGRAGQLNVRLSPLRITCTTLSYVV
jgi:hypothetical protein